MATGTIKKQVTVDLGTPLSPTSYLNTTGTDPTEYKIFRYGNIVQIRGYLNINSTASGTYRDFTLFTGAPPAADDWAVGGAVYLDGTSMLSAMIVATSDGEIRVWVRGQAVNSKKGPFYLMYIAKD